jgi:GTP 3',8-cyclase
MKIIRSQLYEKLPLDTPYSLHVFPTYYCNFRCSYCLQSMSEKELSGLSFRKQVMSFETYKTAIDGLKAFRGKLKALIFAGHGEPLLNKDIDQMVRYAREKGIAERVEIVTNSALLTPELSDRLIEAGLDRLRISIQGINAGKYREICGVEIDYKKLIDNIAYFYEQKRQTDVYVKIIDIALDNQEQKDTFNALFSGISDVADIEYAIPFVPGLDLTGFNTDLSKCKQGHKHVSAVCSMPFYMLVLAPNGDVLPCCNTEVPITYGNVQSHKLVDMWNCGERKKFLSMQLTDRKLNCVCSRCSVPAYGLQEGDYLDDYADELKQLYE